jgi:hypothetical protein
VKKNNVSICNDYANICFAYDLIIELTLYLEKSSPSGFRRFGVNILLILVPFLVFIDIMRAFSK